MLATKTIEGHLANTYRKLGIDNRAQLASVIVPSPDPGLWSDTATG